MDLFLIILLCVLGVVAVVLLLPVTAVFSFDQSFVVTVRVGFLTVFCNTEKKRGENVEQAQETVDEKAEKIAEQMEESTKALSDLKDYTGKFNVVAEFVKEVCRGLQKHMVVKLVCVSYRFGFDNAAVTGIFGGAVYAAVYGFIGTLSQFFKVKETDVNIQPDFDHPGHEIRAELKLRMTVWGILLLFFRCFSLGIESYRIFKLKKAV